jgi:hypothetical protein
MSDASTLLSPAPLGPPQSFQSSQPDATSVLAPKRAAPPPNADAGSIADVASSRLDSIDAETGGLRPPTMQTVPPPTPQSTDPQKVWASAAMIIAGLGSLMTRQPMTTAMNAAAGVLKAYHQGDQEAANQAYQTWKVANDNAMKSAQFENDLYKDALSGLKNRADITDKEATLQEREYTARLTAVAAATRNDTLRDGLQQRGLEWAKDYTLKLKKAADDQAAAAPKLEQLHLTQQAIAEQNQDPDYIAAPPQKKAQMRAQLLAKMDPKNYSAAATRAQDALEQKDAVTKARFDTTVQTIDDVLDGLKSGKYGMSTGIIGHVKRPFEALMNNLGQSDNTDANEFAQKLSYLKATVPLILTGSGSRTNPQLRAQIEAILPGLNEASSPQIVISALTNLRQTLQQATGYTAPGPKQQPVPGLPLVNTDGSGWDQVKPGQPFQYYDENGQLQGGIRPKETN